MKKALVVGINKYPHNPLSGCVNDATEFADLIQTNADQSVNFDVLLKTDVQRKSTLKKLIQDLFSGVNNETVLFYFSGHGAISALGGYLAVPDHEDFTDGISMNEILAIANNSKATNKIIILDCCHSGAINAPKLSPASIGHINEGVTILTASHQGEAASEVKGKGVFTNLLLEALKGGAADLNGNITPGSIYAFIDQALGSWQQRPMFKTNVSRFIPLRKSAPRLLLADLKKITQYFPDPLVEHALDPSYEYTNNPELEHEYKEPYAQENKVAIFKVLQLMKSVGLVETVGAEHMYWAAMNGQSCKLTPLGEHYWRLVKERKI